MNSPDKDNLYIRISEFGRTHPEGFSATELKDALKLNEWEVRIVDEYIRNALMNGQYLGKEMGMQSTLDTMFFAIERGDAAKFIIKYNAFFNYIDYQELQAVKEQSEKSEKHAQLAEKHAKWAIWLAIATATISIISSGFLTYWQIKSPVELDDKQFDKILNNSRHETHFNGFNKEYKNFNYIR